MVDVQGKVGVRVGLDHVSVVNPHFRPDLMDIGLVLELVLEDILGVNIALI